jgi:hypothetical protein
MDQLRKVRFQAFVRTLLVYAHQPRITGHVSGKHRG